MHEEVDLFDRRKTEPKDRFHPEYESFTDWLDALAPASQAQKLRNRPRHRRKGAGNNKLWAPTACHQCGNIIDGRELINHLERHARESHRD